MNVSLLSIIVKARFCGTSADREWVRHVKRLNWEKERGGLEVNVYGILVLVCDQCWLIPFFGVNGENFVERRNCVISLVYITWFSPTFRYNVFYFWSIDTDVSRMQLNERP